MAALAGIGADGLSVLDRFGIFLSATPIPTQLPINTLVPSNTPNVGTVLYANNEQDCTFFETLIQKNRLDDLRVELEVSSSPHLRLLPRYIGDTAMLSEIIEQVICANPTESKAFFPGNRDDCVRLQSVQSADLPTALVHSTIEEWQVLPSIKFIYSGPQCQDQKSTKIRTQVT